MQPGKKAIIGEMCDPDLDKIMKIEEETFSDSWPRSSFEHDIRDREVIALAARFDEECVGYANCQTADDYGYISNIAVDRNHRSKGIGRSLLNHISEELRLRRIYQILLDVRPSNRQAICFYQEYGFSIVTRQPEFYTRPVEDSFTMRMELEH